MDQKTTVWGSGASFDGKGMCHLLSSVKCKKREQHLKQNLSAAAKHLDDTFLITSSPTALRGKTTELLKFLELKIQNEELK